MRETTNDTMAGFGKACFIDAAESFGTEEVVGRAIQGNRKAIFLATKVSPRHFSRAGVMAAADASLKRLKSDYVGLYQFYWANYTIRSTKPWAQWNTWSIQARFGNRSEQFWHPRSAQRAMRKYRIISNRVRYNLIDRTIESGY